MLRRSTQGICRNACRGRILRPQDDGPVATLLHERDAMATQRWLAALSIDAELMRDLPFPGRRASIHSVFERVVNLATGDGHLLTLACRELDNAPDTVVVDVGDWHRYGLKQGAAVLVLRDCIVIGNGLAVWLDEAKPWRGAMPSYPHDALALGTNAAAARHHLERHARVRPFSASTGLDRAVASAVAQRTQGLCQAIARDDEGLAHLHIAELVGLGPGLTPAGDDFLLGLLAVLNITDSPCGKWRRIGSWAVDCAERQTHSISSAALRHAANGRVRERLIAFCAALMRADTPTALAELERVMAIGSSSGRDMASGMLAGFELHLHCEISA
jgi:hypothetical protein